MPCLVSGYNNALGIGKIPYSGVFQAVELIGHRPAQRLPELRPLVTKLVDVGLLRSGSEVAGY